MARWKIKLSEYDFSVVYKPGKANANADALSRNPCETKFCKFMKPCQINTSTNFAESEVESARHQLRDEVLIEGETQADNRKNKESNCIERLVERVFVSHGTLIQLQKIDQPYQPQTLDMSVGGGEGAGSPQTQRPIIGAESAPGEPQPGTSGSRIEPLLSMGREGDNGDGNAVPQAQVDIEKGNCCSVSTENRFT